MAHTTKQHQSLKRRRFRHRPQHKHWNAVPSAIIPSQPEDTGWLHSCERPVAGKLRQTDSRAAWAEAGVAGKLQAREELGVLTCVPDSGLSHESPKSRGVHRFWEQSCSVGLILGKVFVFDPLLTRKLNVKYWFHWWLNTSSTSQIPSPCFLILIRK